MNDAPSGRRRLASLDALRGFDMFWIVGGAGLATALAEATGWGPLRWVAAQCEHVEWHGFRFWDLVFPLFLFVAGAALPFSLERRLERGDDRGTLRLHAVRRGLTLVALGVVYNGLLTFDFENLRYASVLGRIGLGWMFAALIVLHAGIRARVAWVVGLLLGYWAAMSWIPVPGHGAGVLEPGATLADWVDRQLLPGRLHRGDRDPEGILSTIPAIATALSGSLAGTWLRREDVGGRRRAAGLVVAGVAALGLGWLWGLVFPINKNLWTSSFVVWTAGWSLIALGLLHLVIDVWGAERWAFPFVVIGTNAITIYLLHRFVDFDALARLVLMEERLHPVLPVLGALSLEWVVLYALYRKRIFLRV